MILNKTSLTAALLCALLFTSFALPASSAADSSGTTEFALRNKFKDAREQLRAGQISNFKRSARELDSYILKPYLDYYYLNARIRQAGKQEVLAFRDRHADLPATAILYRRWLRSLGSRRQWRSFREHYQPTANAELRCYYLRSLYGTGDKAEALAQTTNVWLQPTSQPKACDPLFEVWRASKHFTEEVAWQRLHAAIVANQRSLANYLTRYFSGANKTAATAFYNVHVGPGRITRHSQFATDSVKYRQVIAHGLIRLARRDAGKADKAWRKYRRSHQFSSGDRQRITERIAVELAEEGIFAEPGQRPEINGQDTLEAMAVAAVRQQNWAQADHWISRLPADLAAKAQWQYWRARALEHVNPDSRLITDNYHALAAERHYYGFLAARNLGVPGRMNDAGRSYSHLNVTLTQRHPGIARAIELFAVGDDLNGRREWYAELDRLNPAQQAAAAELAKQIGLIPLAIRSANIAEATDHLHLRFPLAHEPAFRQGSLASGLPAALLFAVARQESAMEAKARSTADARGLMQLLPSTAKLVARRAKRASPSAADLYDPTTNIMLGSFHMAWLMERYDQQSPLAIAAYNAGEHRVDRWIKDADNLPMDVWIERIPFRETRNYVKNVLAFRHVYANRLSAPSPILEPGEQQVSAR